METTITSKFIEIFEFICGVVMLFAGFSYVYFDVNNNIYLDVATALFCLLMSFVCFTFTKNKITYNEDCLTIINLLKKVTINVKTITSITHSHYVGCYYINFLGNRHILIVFPFKKKELLEMFLFFSKTNPNIKIFI